MASALPKVVKYRVLRGINFLPGGKPGEEIRREPGEKVTNIELGRVQVRNYLACEAIEPVEAS